ncbi:MAG: ABC transporter permease subunit, partial [Eubacteriales bacterium]|nr:ABC transporter permease subunit [Eubacteriales bacterium]
MHKFKNFSALLLCFMAVLLLFAGSPACADGAQTANDDWKPEKLGTFPASPSENASKKHYPDAELFYYPTLSDMTLALTSGKIDGFVLDKAFYQAISWERSDVSYIDRPLGTLEYAYIFSDDEAGRQLKRQMDAFIQTAEESGELKRLQKKWFSSVEPEEAVDLSGLTGENGVLSVAVGSDNKPFIYRKNNRYTGYEIDLLALFAKEYGYSLRMNEVNFEGTLMGVSVGRYDIGAYAFNLMEERKEAVLFSEPTYTGDMVVIIHKPEHEGGETAKTLVDLEQATLGLITGSNWDLVLKEEFPDAKRKYFSTNADMLLSLEQGKVDAVVMDRTVYTSIRWENQSVLAIEEPLQEIRTALVLAKEGYDEVLLEQLNSFIAQKQQDGTLESLSAKWFGDAEPTEHPDYSNLSGENGTLKIALGDSMKPVSYQNGRLYTGYEVEFLTLFAEAYGYDLIFEGMSFEALIPSVTSGKFDIGACGITITPERMESMTFTDPHCISDGLAVVYQGGEEKAEVDFWQGVKESFEKTFIREDRWRLLVEGVGVTMLITVCAAVGGSALGFGLYMLSRSGLKILRLTAKGIAKVYTRIIAGTPVVVILMILFYVVFGKFRDISGILVAIIGFTLTFGAFVFEHMTVSVDSVDRGQTEAAFALGYTRNRAFFRIILPQAMTLFLPSYCAQAVELIKATAVVGYVAVNDLTKMGDIIRSNTYEAFFPLIATAVIYFFLTWMLSLLLGLLRKR